MLSIEDEIETQLENALICFINKYKHYDDKESDPYDILTSLKENNYYILSSSDYEWCWRDEYYPLVKILNETEFRFIEHHENIDDVKEYDKIPIKLVGEQFYMKVEQDLDKSGERVYGWRMYIYKKDKLE